MSACRRYRYADAFGDVDCVEYQRQATICPSPTDHDQPRASSPCRSVPTAPLDAEFVDPGPGRRCARVHRCSRPIHGSQPATDGTGAPRSVALRARAAGRSRSTRPPTCGNGDRRRRMRRSRHVTSVCGLSSPSPSPASTGRTSPTTECWPSTSSRIPATTTRSTSVTHWAFNNLRDAIGNKDTLQVDNLTKKSTFTVRHRLSSRQVQDVLAGGLIARLAQEEN